MLEDKVAVVYGAGGAIGSAVARAFANEGAQVFLTGRLARARRRRGTGDRRRGRRGLPRRRSTRSTSTRSTSTSTR